MTAPRVPLLRLDSGWLFILAGLTVCIASALASADRELQTLRVQQSLLHAEEQYAYARMRAHEDFLMQLDEPDEALARRLAAAELNLMPADEAPVLRLITYDLPTVEWIDRTVNRPAPQRVLASESLLAELATGPSRLWVFGGGVMCVFMGLLLDPSVASSRRRARDNASTESADDDGDSAQATSTLPSRGAVYGDELGLQDDVDAAADAEAEVLEEDDGSAPDDDASDDDADLECEDELEDSADVVLDDELDDEVVDDVNDDHDYDSDEEELDEAWEEEVEWEEGDEPDDVDVDELLDADEENESIADDVEVIELMEKKTVGDAAGEESEPAGGDGDEALKIEPARGERRVKGARRSR